MNESFAGLPMGRWLFASRVWLSIHLALGVAFWLQLDGASSAGVTVAILSLQTRGQILEKSVFRICGTVAGGAASIVIAGLFAQARDLYVVAYSAWLGACVFAAGFLDGNRAYGAVICGYTVSIAAIYQIDKPDLVFASVVDRCAAVCIGIVSITLVNDLLRGPEIGPGLIARVERVIAQGHAYADRILRDGPDATTDAQAVGLMRAVADHRLLLNALPVEAMSGTARAGAVRAALAALVGEVRSARALATMTHGPLHDGPDELRDLIRRRLMGELIARRDAAADALAAAKDGRPVSQPPRMPVYRSGAGAARNGLRAFIACVSLGYAFVLAGWPAASMAWGITGVLMCLASIAPVPRVMIENAAIAIPIAVALAGTTEYVVLDGVDAFPLLMIGTAPALIGSALLAASPNASRAAAGLLMTWVTVAVLGPKNPQDYAPQSYIEVATYYLLAAVLVPVPLSALFPTTDTHRWRWALAAGRRDMAASLGGLRRDRSESEACLLDASRIGPLIDMRPPEPSAMATILRMADLAEAARRISRAADVLPVPLDQACGRMDNRIRAALASADSARLRGAAAALAGSAEPPLVTLAADLAWAADLIDVSTVTHGPH